MAKSKADKPRRHEAPAPALLQFLGSRLLNIHRQQLLVAQQLSDVLGRVAFDEALAFAALGIQCGVFKGTHQESLAYALEG